MKKNILTSLALFLAAMVLIVSCKKEDEAALNPIVKTLDISGITDNSAIGHGYIVQGAKSITEEGICFSSTEELPTINSEKAISTDETAEIVGEMTNLDYKTKYYYRAYAIYAGGVEYGDTMSFISSIRLAVVSADDATAITGISATSGGNVTDLGGGTVTAKGVCWTRDSVPTIENDTTIDGEGLGAFTSELTNLIGGSEYIVRAYAINEAGVSYSDEVTFNTPNYTPIVTTDSIKDIEKTTAKAYGNSLHTGGTDITERGFCWSTTENPTIVDQHIASGTGLGEFEGELTSLTENTTYYVRAYATNSEGTAYGENISFTTKGLPTALHMVGNGVISDAGNEWNWTVDLPMHPVHSRPELFWKIVWLNASGGFKINAVKDWDGNEFGSTTETVDPDNVYDIGGSNVPVPGTEGYYIVVVDLTDNTIEVAPAQVYGMGDVWGNWTTGANAFVVDNANEVIEYVGAPNTGNLRMYAAASTLDCDWWQAEINIVGTDLVYRETGGDPAAFNVNAGETITLNFRTETGSSN